MAQTDLFNPLLRISMIIYLKPGLVQYYLEKAALHKVAAVWPPTIHHENYQS